MVDQIFRDFIYLTFAKSFFPSTRVVITAITTASTGVSLVILVCGLEPEQVQHQSPLPASNVSMATYGFPEVPGFIPFGAGSNSLRIRPVFHPDRGDGRSDHFGNQHGLLLMNQYTFTPAGLERQVFRWTAMNNLTPALVPMRVAPALTIFLKVFHHYGTPPRLSPDGCPTVRRISATSSTVAPAVEKQWRSSQNLPRLPWK